MKKETLWIIIFILVALLLGAWRQAGIRKCLYEGRHEPDQQRLKEYCYWKFDGE